MNPQTVQESRRVLAVMEDLIEDLRILSLLPPYFSSLPQSDMKRIASAFNDPEAAKEVQSQLAEHYKAELRLESQQVGGFSDEDVADHHLGTRALVDTLRQAGYPTPAAAYTPSESVGNFAGVMDVLRSLLEDRLTTSVEDDVVKFVILNDTVNREKTASADVQALNREYQNEKETRRVEVEKRRAAIQKLREELERLRTTSESEMYNFAKVAREMAEAHDAKYTQRYSDLRDEEEKTAADSVAVEERNRRAEAELRQLRGKRENELSEILKHYDKEMTDLTDNITQLNKEIDEDAGELTTVEKRVKVLAAETAQFTMEKKNDELREEHVAELEAKMHSSARVMQSFIRAFSVRQLAAQKGKKKKKKA